MQAHSKFARPIIVALAALLGSCDKTPPSSANRNLASEPRARRSEVADPGPSGRVRHSDSVPPNSRDSRSASSEPRLGQAGQLAYLELTTGTEEREAKLPLIVAIHGLGDRPEHFVAVVEQFKTPARVVLPRGPEAHGAGYSWFQFDPNDISRIAPGIERAAAQLAESIAQIARERPTSGKPIVTGFSQGGMLSFTLAALHPSVVAEAYPLAGWLPPALIAKTDRKTKHPRIVALHGEADPLVLLSATKQAVFDLKSRGFDVQLKTYSGVPHRLSQAMQNDLFELLGEACARALR